MVVNTWWRRSWTVFGTHRCLPLLLTKHCAVASGTMWVVPEAQKAQKGLIHEVPQVSQVPQQQFGVKADHLDNHFMEL